MAKMQLGQGGKGLVRGGNAVLSSGNCCCNCDCIGASVSIALPAMTTGAENVWGDICPDCTSSASSETMPLYRSGRVVRTGDSEAAEYDWCRYRILAPWTCSGYLFLDASTWASDGGDSSWAPGDHDGILFSITFEYGDESGAVNYPMWSASVACADEEYPLPGDVEMTITGDGDGAPCWPVGNAPATLTITGDGCCEFECLACSLEEVTVMLPEFSEGAAAIPCLECDTIPAGPYTVPRDPATYLEGREYECCWLKTGGLTGAGDDCELAMMSVCILDNIGDDGTDVVISLSIATDEFEYPATFFPINFIRQMPKTEFCAAYGTPIVLYPVEDPPSIAAMCSTTGNATVQFGS